MEKILFAIGSRNAEDRIKEELANKGYEYEYDYVVHKNAIIDKFKSFKPDTLIVLESLEGSENIFNIVFTVKKNYPKTRIIFVSKDRKIGDTNLAQLIAYNIHDIIIANRFRIVDVVDLILNPNSFQDVVHLLPTKMDKLTLEEIEILEGLNTRKTLEDGEKISVEIHNDSQNIREKIVEKIVKEKVEVEKVVEKIVEKEKIIVNEKLLGTAVISVTTMEEKSGGTHLSIALATLLNSLGFKVGIIELNTSGAFERIAKYYKLEFDEFFTEEDIDFYPHKEGIEVADIDFNNSYNYLILDMGNYHDFDFNINEFKRSKKKLIINGSKLYERDGLDKFIRKYYIYREDWEKENERRKKLNLPEEKYNPYKELLKYSYCFNFCDKDIFLNVTEDMGELVCYQLPYMPNPFKPVEKLSLIIEDIIPKNTENIIKPSKTSKLLDLIKR